jgi:hypothetical protein
VCQVAGVVSPPSWVFGFGIERVIGQVIGVEVGFYGLEIRHASRDDSGFSCFCNCIWLVVHVRIIVGGLPVLPGTASFEVASVPE